MVIMKDSEDLPWVSVGNVYRKAQKHNRQITVMVYTQVTVDFPGTLIERTASEAVYTAGRLVLFFQEPLEGFHLHDKVEFY